MITGAAYCAQNLIARTTKLVIILMVAGGLKCSRLQGWGEGAVSGVRTKAKWRHGISLSPALNARMRAKVKSWFYS
jgi:hypothetical protein